MSQLDLKDKIGITSTIPIEIIYAARRIPVDLNNIFISDGNSQNLLLEAERKGMPGNSCAWIKGIHSVIWNSGIKVVIGVVQGDCTHMITMLETMLPEGVEFIPFSFPYEKGRKALRWEMQKLMDYFSVQWDDVIETKIRLDGIRKLAHEIDRMTWQQNIISSRDNLYALVNCTDFISDPDKFKARLNSIIGGYRPAFPDSDLRLGLLGVPGVFTDLYDYLESQGCHVVYHEVARQFAMPEYEKGLLEQNMCYTYPYSFSNRLADIKEQIALRRLDGVLHYVQAFCHHQLEEFALRKNLKLPLLNLEGDRVSPLDGRIKTRLDAFIQMLRQKKRRSASGLRD
jgi:benzoyl-CoA reductase/2-hydroxyglutaryl-CoA dehydratase subunit BcrC/BadD/HgdB